MEEKKLKLINFIIRANEKQIDGLEQILIYNDINYGLELILGAAGFDEYILTQARDIYKEDINHALSNLNSIDIEGTKNILREALKK